MQAVQNSFAANMISMHFQGHFPGVYRLKLFQEVCRKFFLVGETRDICYGTDDTDNSQLRDITPILLPKYRSYQKGLQICFWEQIINNCVH